MLLFKDYSTGQKSFTITGFVLSFLVTMSYFVFILVKLIKGQNTNQDVAAGFMTLAFLSIFAALYWNKRIKVSTDGVEVDDGEAIGFGPGDSNDSTSV